MTPPLDIGIERDRPEALQPCTACDMNELAFCAGLAPGPMARLVAIVGQTQVPANTTIFREGDPAQHLYSVAAGAVKLYKLLSDGRRQMTGFLAAGDFFGLAIDGAYAYTAETLTPVSLCRFPWRKLEAVMDEVPQLERRLLTMAIHELAAAQEQMLLLGRKTAREKVASFLLLLWKRAARRSCAPGPLALPMSRSDIADYLGLTIETVSRTLTGFKRDGVLGLPDTAHVVIRQIDVVRKLAEGG